MISLQLIHNAVKSGNIIWQYHSVQMMIERNISAESVIESILRGEVIEEYPDDRPFPSTLILGWSAAKPIHAVCSYNEKLSRVHIITVYEPDADHFLNDFKTRSSK